MLSHLSAVQPDPPLVPYKTVFREALREVGVIPDLQALIWGYYERKPFTFGSSQELPNPFGVCVDKKGLVYVSDSDNHRVQIYSADGKLLQSILSDPPDSPSFFQYPVGIAVGPGGSIYICGFANDVVVAYQSDGKFLRQIAPGHYPATTNFGAPRGVALNADGTLIYMTDIGRCRVSVFTSDGNFSHYIGKSGSGIADLSTPSNVAVGPDGNVYVADDTMGRVQVYTPSGQHVRQIGQFARIDNSSPPGYLSNPWGVAVSSEGLVYVANPPQRAGVHLYRHLPS